MKLRQATFAAVAAVLATTVFAGEVDVTGVAAAAPKDAWEFALTAYPTVVRGGDNYASAIATADRGPLHFEARHNYESVGARPVFVGWNPFRRRDDHLGADAADWWRLGNELRPSTIKPLAFRLDRRRSANFLG